MLPPSNSAPATVHGIVFYFGSERIIFLAIPPRNNEINSMMNLNKTNVRLCTPSFQGGTDGKQYALLFGWASGHAKDARGNAIDVPIKAFAKTKAEAGAKAKAFLAELTENKGVTARLDHQPSRTVGDVTYPESWLVNVDPAPSNPEETAAAIDALLAGDDVGA